MESPPPNPGPSPAPAAARFDLSQVYVHLGLGARAETLPDFTWSEEYLRRYEADHEADGDEGRLVMTGPEEATWTSWERHPAGDEVVVALSGHQTLIQEVDGKQHRIERACGASSCRLPPRRARPSPRSRPGRSGAGRRARWPPRRS